MSNDLITTLTIMGCYYNESQARTDFISPSSETQAQLKARISYTDKKIDQLVYQLY